MNLQLYPNSTPSAFGASPKSETEIGMIIQTARSDLGEAGRGL